MTAPSPFFQIVTPDEALIRLFDAWSPPPVRSERVPAAEAPGRVLAEDVVAAEDLPAFDRSTVDGYAVRAADTFGASEGLPSYLKVVGEVVMGRPATVPVGPGEAVWIPTGGMLPPGADAVVMVEETETVDEGLIEVKRPVGPGDNVLRRGEDVAAGRVALERGRRLTPPDLGLLAALGRTHVEVAAPPAVAIVSTGDEIVPPERRPQPGQVRDVNAATLSAMVEEEGGRPIPLGVVPDAFEPLVGALRQAWRLADVVLVSGGSSVGPRDLVARAIGELGPPGVVVHGVAMKPGKPTLLAVADGKPVVGLPGHPTTVMIVFHVFVRPILWALLGRRPSAPLRVGARLARRVASAPGREDYLRVALEMRDDGLWAVPLLGKSGLLSTMVNADALVRIPLEREGIDAGEMVEAELLTRPR